MAERLLVLGGTAEAAALAARAVTAYGDRLAITLSLAGRLPTPAAVPAGVAVRIGGFGGAEGLARYLDASGTTLLIDATHPFAAAISRHAADAAARTGTSRLMLVRPPWPSAPGDRITLALDGMDAARRLPDLGRRAFLATGPGSAADFAPLTAIWFLVRAFAPPPAPLPLARHMVIVQRPPFTLAGESDLMRAHAIDVLVCKQSGGPTDAKLAAARALGLPVLMIDRPPLPAGERAETVDAALAWLGQRLD